MSTKEEKRLIENRMTSYDLIVQDMDGEMKASVSKTLGVLYTEQSSAPFSEETPLHIGVYFYCIEEPYSDEEPDITEKVIVIHQSFWTREDGNMVNDTYAKLSLSSAMWDMQMDSYDEIKAYFLKHFSQKMAFYKLIRFFIRNDIEFGCNDEELVEEFEEEIRDSESDPEILDGLEK